MASKSLTSQINFWQLQKKETWHATPYPWKPGKLDLCFFAIYIIRERFRNKRSPALLIGCTKEIRQLFNLFSVPYDLIDFSANMEVITRPKNDRYLSNFSCVPWTTSIATKNESYSLILGDLILNLIPNSERHLTIENFYNYLKKNGNLLLRTRLLTVTKKEILLLNYRQQLNSLTKGNLYSCFANYQTLCTLFQTQNILTDKEIKELSNKKLFQYFFTFFIQSPLEYYLFNKRDASDLFKNNWKIAWYSFQLDKKTFDDYVFIVCKKL